MRQRCSAVRDFGPVSSSRISATRSAGAKALPNVSGTGGDAHGDAAAEQQRGSAADERKQPDDRRGNRDRGDAHDDGHDRFVNRVDVAKLVLRELRRLPISEQRGPAGDGERRE